MLPATAPSTSAIPRAQQQAGSGSWAALSLQIIAGILLGVLESLQVFTFLGYCLRSSAITKDFLRCFVLNAVLFYSLHLISNMVSVTADSNLAKKEQKQEEFSSDLFIGLWNLFFSIGWVVPMYAVTQILGLSWWENLYKETVREKHKRDGAKLPPQRSFRFVDIGEAALKFVTTLAFALIAQAIKAVLCWIPFMSPLGHAVYFCLGSLLHAFYCFDYRFADQGMYVGGVYRPIKLSTVIKLFELCWAYYLGYGATNVAMRTVLEYLGVPTFAVLAFYSTIFCVNVVTSVDAKPGPETPALQPPFFSALLQFIVQFPTMLHKLALRMEKNAAGRFFVSSMRGLKFSLFILWEYRLIVGTCVFMSLAQLLYRVYRNRMWALVGGVFGDDGTVGSADL